MIEEWKKIPGTEFYEISNFGRVRSKERAGIDSIGRPFRKRERILNYGIDTQGYRNVCLYINGKRTTKLIHQLVAEAFVDNEGNFFIINHIDENKQNNIFSNLEWCNQQYNMEQYSSRKWYFISPDGEETEIFNLSKFCRENNLHQSAMQRTYNGKQSQHKGWIKWK